MGIKKLVIASVLKPVDDTRIYEKFSISLAKTNKYEINIIGFSTKKISIQKNINFYPLFTFYRLSLQRFIAPLSYFKLLIRIKPDLIIATTYELLLPSIFYTWIGKGKIIYDIRENYAKNAIYNHGIPKPVRYIWALVIGLIERITHPWIAHYILAEKGYQKELRFIGNKFTVIENKVLFSDGLQKSLKKEAVRRADEIRFIYSGTITKIYGIYQAINLFLDIRKFISNATFTITGHFPYKEDFVLIRSIANHNPSITVKGGLAPVPHSKIMAEIAQANFGFISHQPVASIENCFPTRIYEYMAFQLPIILQNHPLWTTYCQTWDSAIVIDYNNYHCSEIIEQIQKRNFYKKGIPASIFWQNQEEMCLIQLVYDIIHQQIE